MTYDSLLEELKSVAEPTLAAFHGTLIKASEDQLFGVRTPILRKIAKRVDIDEILSFPNDYYEVKFIKLIAVSYLPYERFIEYVGKVVPLIDNWALCDSFKANSIKAHKEDFLSRIEQFFVTGKEFFVRYALVTLLSYYVEREYLPLIFSYLERVETSPYYVHMSAAWLLAEVLVKYYEDGVAFLQKRSLDAKTHNKAIQKAVESFRLTNEQKEFLKTLKIKNY